MEKKFSGKLSDLNITPKRNRYRRTLDKIQKRSHELESLFLAKQMDNTYRIPKRGNEALSDWINRLLRILAGEMPDEAARAYFTLLANKCFSADCISTLSLNLPEAVVRNVDLAGVDLTNSTFSGSYVSGVNFNGANLSNTDFSSTILIDCDLRTANLSNSTLHHAWIQGDLSGAILDQADLEESYITGDLKGASLVRSNLQNVWLRLCDLDGANLRGANVCHIVNDWVTIGDGTTIMPDGTMSNPFTNGLSKFSKCPDKKALSLTGDSEE